MSSTVTLPSLVEVTHRFPCQENRTTHERGSQEPPVRLVQSSASFISYHSKDDCAPRLPRQPSRRKLPLVNGDIDDVDYGYNVDVYPEKSSSFSYDAPRLPRCTSMTPRRRISIGELSIGAAIGSQRRMSIGEPTQEPAYCPLRRRQSISGVIVEQPTRVQRTRSHELVPTLTAEQESLRLRRRRSIAVVEHPSAPRRSMYSSDASCHVDEPSSHVLQSQLYRMEQELEDLKRSLLEERLAKQQLEERLSKQTARLTALEKSPPTTFTTHAGDDDDDDVSSVSMGSHDEDGDKIVCE